MNEIGELSDEDYEEALSKPSPWSNRKDRGMRITRAATHPLCGPELLKKDGFQFRYTLRTRMT